MPLNIVFIVFIVILEIRLSLDANKNLVGLIAWTTFKFKKLLTLIVHVLLYTPLFPVVWTSTFIVLMLSFNNSHAMNVCVRRIYFNPC